ncbi:MAG: SPASM domain-containing protein [Flavobacteriales bacterium]|nr:SPASM domain-containing protein [Bacteroidota bacterium]MCB9240810.1 SPASM domain-containing protein [Flavobacteriales bacterium]
MIAGLADFQALLKVVTVKRSLNFFRLIGSYYRSRITGKNLHRGLPVTISIEPTTSCNLRCPQCPSGLRQFTRDTGMLQQDLNRKIIDELHPTLAYITYYFQGEPYLNRDFLQMVRYAADHRIYTATSTNAHYLTPDVCEDTIQSGLNRLIISIDGVDQESYARYRIGGQLEKVLEGSRNIVEAKRKHGKGPQIVWQFIAFKHNEDQIQDVKKLAKEIGVDKLVIKTAQIYDFDVSDNLIPTNETLSRYRKVNGAFQIKNKLLNHCWRLWHSSVITWDGKVAPCCFDKDASHQFGDLYKQTFHSIWTNPSYNSFRKLVLKSRKNIDICQNCTEGTKIWA